MEISLVRWHSAESSLRMIRQKVFVEEQEVPEDLEWDNLDAQAVHILGKEGNHPVACARITGSDTLGRVAVLKDYRGHGWGDRLIRAAEQHLLGQNKFKLSLSAQANSYSFYFKNGYRYNNEMSWDAAIPHLRMTKILGRPSPLDEIFILGKDSKNHDNEQPASSSVWFQIASSQARREIEIQIKDLAHPVFNNPNCLDNLRKFVRYSHQRKVRVLINQEIPGLSEHPLLQLQQRMSSRIQIRCMTMKSDSDNIGNHIVFDDSGHLRFDYRSVHCCFDNRLSVKRFKEAFQQGWEQSKPLVEGRSFRI